MRGLADRLGVKAASLYWHLRDRRELVELLAGALFEEVRLPRAKGSWREQVLALCESVNAAASRYRDADRILLEAPEAVEASDVHQRLASVLETAGLTAATAAQTATLMLLEVLLETRQQEAGPLHPRPPSHSASLVAIDAGSRGVALRAGSGMTGLIRVAHDPTAAAPAIVRGEDVIVRRLRGAGQGELELNPDHPWRVKVQGPTWNTRLDLSGLQIRDIHIDGGASRIECVLPPPEGEVPIKVSGGVVGVALHRPPGVPVMADISTGAVKLKLDGFALRAAARDLSWSSDSGPPRTGYYRLRISGGAVNVTLDEDASLPTSKPASPTAQSKRPARSVLELLLDGVEHQPL